MPEQEKVLLMFNTPQNNKPWHLPGLSILSYHSRE